MVRTTKIGKRYADGINAKISSGSTTAFDVLANFIRAKNGSKNRKGTVSYGVDELDLAIMRYMLMGYGGIQIADKTKTPLSTVQRRSRRLFQDGLVIPIVHLNFNKFGLRRGILYLKCKSSKLDEAVNQISKIGGVESAAAYLGSLDILVNVVYADSKEVLRIIGDIQLLDLITDVSWAEEIHSMPI